MNASIACKNVSKTWPADRDEDQVEALRFVNFDVAPGEFIILLGPSGCGKSTLLYMIAGLEHPTSGSVLAHGTAVDKPDADRILIFQEASLFPWLTVAENVSFGLSLQGASKDERRQKAEELLQEVGLAASADKRPDQLSGGMRQRVAVARALAMRPSILMMDEPFAALDVQTRSKMQGFLQQIWRESGASVVLVTHSIEEAIALADRVVVFTARPGKVKEIVPIDLPRPRNPRDPAFRDLQDHLADLLAEEVDNAFEQQEL
ncbi:ABC transporter ATP-binding protein [Pseudooceanicola sp.]|uniref:ABC transporter ATP-binding protein n=1 Tax=Pseudooceanicola sp. TaxID=1914328 RepID=UPI00260AED99|nr:ABC transporter ATP-binding protein [Pseudooceanicola sp.]MDF1856065.1 ABC transporter ATP-binding protein [Pseudooceanicola sp.]